MKNRPKLKGAFAWRMAYEQRACPTDAILFSPTRSKQLMAHLGFCSFCNERLEMNGEELQSWQAIADNFPAECTVLRPEMKAGQVWSLQQALAGWGPHERYYLPPKVLLLERLEGAKGFLTAQLFNQQDLMAAGDLWIPEIRQFVETWNTYPVHVDSLHRCYGEISLSRLVEARRLVSQDLAPDLRDPLHKAFRELEVDVAGYISMQVVEQLVEDYEAAAEKVAEGITVLFNEVTDYMISLTRDGLECMRRTFEAPTRMGSTFSSVLYPVFHAAFVETLSAVASLPAPDSVKEEIGNRKPSQLSDEQVDKLKEIPLLPLEWYQRETGCMITFRAKPGLELPSQVEVTVGGAPLHNFTWQDAESTLPKLAIPDVVIAHGKGSSDSPIFRLSYHDGVLSIDLMPVTFPVVTLPSQD